VDKRS
jgi:hypothetical protein